MQATRVQARLAAVAAAEQPAEPETLTFDEWWAMKGEQLGGETTANLVASGVIAAMVTIFVLCSLAMLTVLRREHAWSRPVLHDEYEEEPEHLAQAKAGPAGDHLYDDEEDVPKLEDRFRI
jgi:hypothetical protein